MSKKTRRVFSADQKALAVKRHCLENIPASQICDELEIHPNVFSDWKKKFFENGSTAFVRESNREQREAEKKIAHLEAKVSHKEHVISEIMTELVDVKKKLGAP